MVTFETISYQDFCEAKKTDKQLSKQDVNKKFIDNVWKRKYGRQSIQESSASFISAIHGVETSFKDPLSLIELTRIFLNYKKAIPAGSVIYGLGSTKPVSISNCFVVDSPVDSYGGICKTDQEQVQIMKRRGGVGIDISTLRPAGSQVNNSAQTSSGAVSFAKRFSYTTGEVAQDGRRGALMLSMAADHPDIMEFIKAKEDKDNGITKANISVRVQDFNNTPTVILSEIAKNMHKAAEPKYWDLVA